VGQECQLGQGGQVVELAALGISRETSRRPQRAALTRSVLTSHGSFVAKRVFGDIISFLTKLRCGPRRDRIGVIALARERIGGRFCREGRVIVTQGIMSP